MSLLDPKTTPSLKERRLFGVLALAFFAGLSLAMGLKSGHWALPVGVTAVSAVITAAYYRVPALQLPLYRTWMLLAFPIGWVVSHLVLGVAWYLVLTPIGLVMRLLGRDVLQRRVEPERASYWSEHHTGGDPAGYFRQF